jgi:hypothetical protein
VFRGQSDARAGLEPSIERVTPDSSAWRYKEEYIQREFKRRAHHYLCGLPEKEDVLGWLALARRHLGSSLGQGLRNVAAFFGAVGTAIDQAELKKRALAALSKPDAVAMLREPKSNLTGRSLKS